MMEEPIQDDFYAVSDKDFETMEDLDEELDAMLVE